MELEEKYVSLLQTFLMDITLFTKMNVNMMPLTIVNFKDTFRIMDIKKAIAIKIKGDENRSDDSQLNKIVDDLEIEESEENHKTTISSKNPVVQNLIETMKKEDITIKKWDFYGRGFLITNLTNTIESTLVTLSSWAIKNFNLESNGYLNRSVKITDLDKFADIDEVKEYALSRYINDLTYKGAEEWIGALAKIVDPGIKNKPQYKENIDRVKELYLRRNIIIHNNGKVNDQYIDKIPKSLKENFPYKKDEVIEITDQYIDEMFKFSTSIILLFFSNLFIKVIEKIQDDKERTEKFLWDLNNVTIDLFNNGFYKEGRYIYNEFGKKSQEVLGEKEQVTYFLQYNSFLGQTLSNEINFNAIERFFNYFEDADWWNESNREYKEISKNSLLKSREKFTEYALNKAEKLQAGNDQDKKMLTKMLDWPLFILANKNNEWTKFIDNLYNE